MWKRKLWNYLWWQDRVIAKARWLYSPFRVSFSFRYFFHFKLFFSEQANSLFPYNEMWHWVIWHPYIIVSIWLLVGLVHKHRKTTLSSPAKKPCASYCWRSRALMEKQVQSLLNGRKEGIFLITSQKNRSLFYRGTQTFLMTNTKVINQVEFKVWMTMVKQLKQSDLTFSWTSKDNIVYPMLMPLLEHSRLLALKYNKFW